MIDLSVSKLLIRKKTSTKLSMNGTHRPPGTAARLPDRGVSLLLGCKISRSDIAAAPAGSYLVSHIILALLECQP